MGRIILLVGFELAGSIRHYFPILHKDTSQPLSRCITIDDKIPLNVWQSQHRGCCQSSFQLLKAFLTRLSPVELLLLLEQLHHGLGNLRKSFNNDGGNDDFQEPDKTVNVLFGGLPSRWEQKATRREVMSIEPAVPTPFRWSEVPITFSRADQWTSFSEPGRFPLVLKPVVAGSRLNKVLIDGGSGLNVLFAKTLKKMGLDITHMLTKSTAPFYGIVPGNAAIPLGSVVLPVTFGESRDNYRTEYVKFEVADFGTSYHAILGRPAITKFMAIPHYTYLVLKMPSPVGVLSLQGDLKISHDCDTEAVRWPPQIKYPTQ
jgi:hypothetical protein